MTEKKNEQAASKKRLSLADLHEVVAGDNGQITSITPSNDNPKCGPVSNTICR